MSKKKPKSMEMQQWQRFEVFKVLHQTGQLQDICKRAIALIQEYFNCEAIALRLRNGEDYPYYVRDGFPEEFIASENNLLCRNAKGKVVRDARGIPVLECMCGIVLNNKLNRQLSCLTQEGSFWTNSTTDLLTSASLEGIHSRNVCHQYGYESVALIPIKSTKENVGLLQLNDKKRDLFTPESIAFLEELGHILGMCIERKEAEEEIASLAKFPSENPNPVIRATQDGTIIYANVAGCRILDTWGCEVGKPITEWWRALIRGVEATNESRQEEAEFNARTFLFEIIPVKDASYVNLYGYDITVRKRAEGALRESEEKYRSLVTNIPDVAWTADFEGNTTFISPNVEKVYGFSPEEIYEAGDRLWFGRIHPDDIEKVKEAFKVLFEKGAPFNIEYRVQRKDGEWIWLHDRSITAYEKGGVTFADGVFSDVTERKKSEEVLQQQRRDLQKANQELDHFVYSASHDLRAPLRAVSSFASFLEEDYKDKLNEEGKSYLDKIRKSAQKMDTLIDSLLMLSKISRIRNPYENVDMNHLIQEVLEQIGFDQRKEKVHLVIQSGMPTVYCDRIKMGEVFLNLVSNAVKFSTKNNHEEPRIEIGYVDQDGQHAFFVRDNGIGIKAEFHEEIFEIFRRLHPDREYEGTGAGLSIVKRIMEGHGGQVRVESDIGKGATFYVTIPKILNAQGSKI